MLKIFAFKIYSTRSFVTLLSLATLTLTSLARGADAPQQIPLWPAAAPGEKGDIGEEMTKPMNPGDPTIRLTNVTKPTITVFRPPAEKNTGAAVVICPGGGYGILAFNKEGTDVAEWLNTLGVTGIVLKYRVPGRKDRPGNIAPLEDAQRAVGLVRHRASEFGVDPTRIGVLGFSAGGHLAARLSTNYEERAYEPVDDADRVSCRPDFAMLVYPAYLTLPKEVDKLAPEIKVTATTPRTFLVHTQDDGQKVEHSVFYYLALRNAKIPAEMHLYPAGGHGYGLRPANPVLATWPQRAEQWLGSLGVLEMKR